ncbi:MAG: Trm112 family protein [Thermoanaerobaculia bacterium]
MSIDRELLEILACPLCKKDLEVVKIEEKKAREIEEKFKQRLPEEKIYVEEGLQCIECKRVYPIVSDIPVMLIEDAFIP